MTPDQQIRRYLESGDYDMLYGGWPGSDIVVRGCEAERVLRQALVKEVCRRAKDQGRSALHPDFDSDRFTLDKVGPMVRGLFPAREQPPVFELFKNSLMFVTHENIEPILVRMNWLGTAWSVANLYLGSLGLPGLDGKPVNYVGLSEETSLYVSMDYFGEKNPFADYVVHEAAHMFHNWKRNRAGLPYTRKREFLLQIDFGKRELFAYACEAYSRIIELAGTKNNRQCLLAEYEAKMMPDDDRITRSELIDILTLAIAARNGWKSILQSCSPPLFSRNIVHNPRIISCA